MKRAVLYNPEELKIEECEIPKINDNEVLLKNKISTTCGTDVKIYKRGYPLLTPPHPFGHELSGEIIEVGNNVKDFKVGDRVAIHNTAPCNTCYYCKRGQPSLCESLVFNRGTYAEFVKIPKEIVKQNMFVLPEGMSHKQASLMEPLSCAVYGIEQVSIHQGDVVIVNGAGPIGLMFIRLAYLRGASVIATDLSDYRLSIAKKMGAVKVVNMTTLEHPIEHMRTLVNDGIGADVVIEATGLISIWEDSISMVRKGGEVLLFGGTKKDSQLHVDATLLHYQQINIKGVFHTTPLCVESAFRLLKENVINADDYIQNEYSIDNLEDAIIEHAQQKVIKNCIVYD